MSDGQKIQRATATEEEILDGLVAAARAAGEEGLVVLTSGNFSARLPGERFAISASRSRLGALRREDLVILRVDGDGRDSGGARRPSSETPLHRAIYRAHPRIGSVLHFQSPAATALACRPGPLPDLGFIPEIAAYVRRVADVPYLEPGTEALAAAVAAGFRDPEARVAQLRNHGQVAVGDSAEQTLERAAFFELAAGIFLLSGGAELRCFSAEERRVLESYGR